MPAPLGDLRVFCQRDGHGRVRVGSVNAGDDGPKVLTCRSCRFGVPVPVGMQPRIVLEYPFEASITLDELSDMVNRLR